MENVKNIAKIYETIGFIKGKFGKIQMYNTRNIVGDYMENIYADNGIYIDYSGNGYVEIFGLTEEEFNEVKKQCGDNIFEYEF